MGIALWGNDSLEAMAHIPEHLLGLAVGHHPQGVQLVQSPLVVVELLLQLLDADGALLVFLLKHGLDARDLVLVRRGRALQVLVHIVCKRLALTAAADSN